MPVIDRGRRAFLRGLGGVVVGLPFLESVSRPERARAATAPPKRCILWSWPNGVVIDRWTPEAAADGAITKLSPILAPFSAHLRYLLPVSGLRLGSALVPEDVASGHGRGAGALFTGSRLSPAADRVASFALSHSVDRELATRLAPPTRFPVLRLQVGRAEPTPVSTLFYDAPGVPGVPNPSPWDVHRLLFSDQVTDPVVFADIVSRRRTVLDAVIEEYAALRCRVGAEDRPRLDQHLDAIREVERGLDAFASRDTGCAPPDFGADPGYGQVVPNDALPELGRLQMDLLATALACDATRIAAIQWSAPAEPLVHTWLGHTEEHHTLSHRGTGAADDVLTEICAWYAGQLAALFDRLAAITAEDGGTLLDHTALLASTEVSVGWNHGLEDCAFLLAGGAGGAWRPGRHLRFAGENHGRLLLTLLHAMGVEAETFGDPRTCAGGPLPGVLA